LSAASKPNSSTSSLVFSSDPAEPDHPGGTHQPGDLSGRAAHGSGRAGHEDHVARLDRGQPQQARVGGQAGVAEYAEVGRQRRGGRVEQP